MLFALKRHRLALTLLTALAIGLPAAHAEDVEINITLENNRFVPEEIKAPAGKRIKILVLNKDATPEEFESSPLKIEKLIAAGSRGLIFVKPQQPGRYPFFGEFHQSTAQGVLIVE